MDAHYDVLRRRRERPSADLQTPFLARQVLDGSMMVESTIRYNRSGIIPTRIADAPQNTFDASTMKRRKHAFQSQTSGDRDREARAHDPTITPQTTRLSRAGREPSGRPAMISGATLPRRVAHNQNDSSHPKMAASQRRLASELLSKREILRVHTLR